MRLYLRLQRAQTNPKVHHIKHVLRYWFKLRPRSFWLERLGTRHVPPGSIWPDSKSGRTRNIAVRLDTARNEKGSIQAFLSPSRPKMKMDHRMSGMKTNQIWVKHQDPLNPSQEEKPACLQPETTKRGQRQRLAWKQETVPNTERSN